MCVLKALNKAALQAALRAAVPPAAQPGESWLACGARHAVDGWDAAGHTAKAAKERLGGGDLQARMGSVPAYQSSGSVLQVCPQARTLIEANKQSGTLQAGQLQQPEPPPAVMGRCSRRGGRP